MLNATFNISMGVSFIDVDSQNIWRKTTDKLYHMMLY